MDKKHGFIIALIARIRGKANEFIIREMEHRNIKGLAPSHGDILVTLLFKGPIKMKDLADAIHKKKNTVTTLVEKLIVQGYVEKLTDENDNRISLISLTSKGESLRTDFFEISENLITKVYTGMEEAEKDQIIKSLKKIYENLK